MKMHCSFHGRSPRLLAAAILLAMSILCSGWAVAADAPAGRYPMIQAGDEAKFYRRTFPDERSESFFNFGGKAVVFELTKTPLPFVDWAMVECGHVGWMGPGGEVAPLNDPHDIADPDSVIPVPFSIASGVRLRAQPATQRLPFDAIFTRTLPWEQGSIEGHTLIHDADVNLYRLWYYCAGSYGYAESRDLKTWEKPLLNPNGWGEYEKTNLAYIFNKDELASGMFQHPNEIHPGGTNAFFQDPSAAPGEMFKNTIVASTDIEKLTAFTEKTGKPLSPMVSPNSGNCMYGMVSPDGIGWRVILEPIMLHDADTLTVIHRDPAIDKYVMFTRLFEFGRRTVARTESDDFRDFPLPHTVIGSEPSDPPYLDFYANACAFYPGNPDIRLIFPMVYDRSIDRSHIELAISRDGRMWSRVPGGAILAGSGGDEAWDASFVHARSSFARMPDGRMMIMYGGNRLPHKFPRAEFADGGGQSGGNGIAWWEADRLVALEAPERGEFTTPYMKLRGARLVLNMQTERAGAIQVELYDEDFMPIPGRTFAEADLLTGDDVARTVTWSGQSDLSDLRDKLIYLRFRMRAAKLFALGAGE